MKKTRVTYAKKAVPIEPGDAIDVITPSVLNGDERRTVIDDIVSINPKPESETPASDTWRCACGSNNFLTQTKCWDCKRTQPSRRPVPVTGEDGMRACMRDECGARFRPRVLTQYFCGDDCTILSARKTFGLKTVDVPVAITGECDDPEKTALKLAKYGPLRDVTEVLEEPVPPARSQRVKLECGHETTCIPGMQRQRCRACMKEIRKGAEVAPITESKSKRRVARETPESVNGDSTSESAAPKKRVTKPRGDDIALSAKYGPLRAVVEHLSESGKRGGHRVRFECGHEGNCKPSMTHQRCRKCLRGAPVVESGARRSSPEKPAKKPAKSAKTAKSAKKSPKKSNKKSKKGKK